MRYLPVQVLEPMILVVQAARPVEQMNTKCPRAIQHLIEDVQAARAVELMNILALHAVLPLTLFVQLAVHALRELLCLKIVVSLQIRTVQRVPFALLNRR